MKLCNQIMLLGAQDATKRLRKHTNDYHAMGNDLTTGKHQLKLNKLFGVLVKYFSPLESISSS